MSIYLLRGKFKPYVRMTRRGKWIDPEAQAYLVSQANLIAQLRQQMNGQQMLPARTPLKVVLWIIAPRVKHNCDIDNQAKALLDAAKGIIYDDDHWIDSLGVTRLTGAEEEVIFLAQALEVNRVD